MKKILISTCLLSFFVVLCCTQMSFSQPTLNQQMAANPQLAKQLKTQNQKIRDIKAKLKANPKDPALQQQQQQEMLKLQQMMQKLNTATQIQSNTMKQQSEAMKNTVQNIR